MAAQYSKYSMDLLLWVSRWNLPAAAGQTHLQCHSICPEADKGVLWMRRLPQSVVYPYFFLEMPWWLLSLFGCRVTIQIFIQEFASISVSQGCHLKRIQIKTSKISLYWKIPNWMMSTVMAQKQPQYWPKYRSECVLNCHPVTMGWVFWVLIVTAARAKFPELHATSSSSSQARLMSVRCFVARNMEKAKFSDPDSNAHSETRWYSLYALGQWKWLYRGRLHNSAQMKRRRQNLT